MRRALVLALALAAAPAVAAPMTGEEFRAASEGWTLHFRDANGVYFGSEQYFENGRTIWKPAGGACAHGLWAQDRDRICFLYDNGTACWRLYADGADGIFAKSADGDGRATRIWLMKRDQSALICEEGPGV